jgi:hypothetical protein
VFQHVHGPIVIGSRNFVAYLFAVAPVQALEEKGFVRFKKAGGGNNTSKTSSVIIPEHIRAKLPDPLAHYASKKPATVTIVAKSSADSLREELAKLRAEQDSRTNVDQAVPRKRAAPPPPPPLSFGRKKR